MIYEVVVVTSSSKIKIPRYYFFPGAPCNTMAEPDVGPTVVLLPSEPEGLLGPPAMGVVVVVAPGAAPAPCPFAPPPETLPDKS